MFRNYKCFRGLNDSIKSLIPLNSKGFPEMSMFCSFMLLFFSIDSFIILALLSLSPQFYALMSYRVLVAAKNSLKDRAPSCSKSLFEKLRDKIFLSRQVAKIA